MAKSPTIYDVAERAGVSKSLVSLVLRDSPRVSETKREAVLAAVKELDYTPSHLAASLAGTRTRNIGVVVDEFDNLWFVPALAGLRRALAAGGYTLSIADASLNSHLRLDPVDVFRSLRVDGLVLAGEVSAEAAERLGMPGVVLGTRTVRPAGLPVVASDEVAGGRLATAHLADLGHERILCLSAPGASAGDRERGYLDEMRERGLEPRVLRAEQTSERAAREALLELLADPASSAPTAVFAVNDPMAVGATGALRERGLLVPRDISVVGYDDSPLAAYEYLSLTSVDGDAERLGEAAGQLLAELLEDPGARGREASSDSEGDRAAVLLPPRLVVRGSTASPQRSSEPNVATAGPSVATAEPKASTAERRQPSGSGGSAEAEPR